ncbi:hypothetical protein ASD44_10525 [Mesorhizobium sp. Root554]|uniref:hypothetical protein n=1 Tax=unclassified Mesorhizobium TaxID=325217 RepID=UPI0006FF5221|nr:MULTISPECIES: hypothetical protein [unclassified Mesorhizobium]KQZ14456.1 hypothetical protein ASD27_10535 [Mesorhizobium sp. Root1471]KQZ36965.1 hypothetical protein ASD44_10525 [Mesorhizobium sp. Root554]
MKARDAFISHRHRFSLGSNDETGQFYLSIPVGNRLADYEEYYALTPEEFERFLHDEEAAASFANRCRTRQLDHLLVVPPGSDRGQG